MPITITPSGSITLVKTPLENDYKNTFTFSSLAAQSSYFDGLSNKILAGNDYTYMKKDGKIRVAIPIDTIINYNYCYYNNGGFTTKRYYCFITRMEYVNENCTDIFIETDVFQTWYFDIVWNRCFVEREHVNNDTRGANTLPENVETGEYITNQKIRGISHKAYNIYVGSTIDLEDDDATILDPAYDNINGCNVGGVYSGLKYYEFYDTQALSNMLARIANSGRSNAIVSMFMGDGSYVDSTPSQTHAFNIVDDYTAAKTRDFTYFDGQEVVSPPSNPVSLNGYTPRNNKLLTFPYCYIMASNNCGSSTVYKYELFDSAPNFRYIGTLCPGMSVKLQPLNYKGEAVNNNEGLVFGKFPVCAWNTDVYTNWLTQNSINIASSIAGDMGSIAIGGSMISAGLTLGGAGNVVSGVTGIANTIGSIYQHSLIPPQINGDMSASDVTYSGNDFRIDLSCMSIKAEYARVIDSYFDCFGYKVNTVKVPNITGRSQWNYIKTIDCNADGDIPQEDLETIKKACNKGITFWHNPANIYNYSLSNTIV